MFALTAILAWQISGTEALGSAGPVSFSNGDRLTADLQLLHVSKRPIGILEVVLPSRPGDDRSALLGTAVSIGDELARRLSRLKNLLKPAQFDSSMPTAAYAPAFEAS